MDDSDSELIRRYRSGDASALEALYWRHAQRVWRYARYFSNREEQAAEILQETFARVVQHLKNFEGRAQFTTWLFTVVRSVAVENSRRHARTPLLDEPEMANRIPTEHPGPVEQLALDETRAAVRAAIARLPESEREVVLLCEIEELPLKAACEILGWGEPRVKVTLFRARRRLKDILASHVRA
jgi:RNA polymerase sigma-70 factor (ECF subfamily)